MNRVYRAEEIFEDIPGDPDNVLMNIPQEILDQAGLVVGDTIKIKVENGSLVISRL